MIINHYGHIPSENPPDVGTIVTIMVNSRKALQTRKRFIYKYHKLYTETNPLVKH